MICTKINGIRHPTKASENGQINQVTWLVQVVDNGNKNIRGNKSTFSLYKKLNLPLILFTKMTLFKERFYLTLGSWNQHRLEIVKPMFSY